MTRKVCRSFCVLLAATLIALTLASCFNSDQSSTEDTNQQEIIPGDGGEVSDTTGNSNGNHINEYSFTPEETGFWFMHSSTEGDGDMTFKVFGSDDGSIKEVSDYTTIYLEADSTYIIEANYWKYTVGSPLSFTLRVALAEALPGSGSEVTVNNLMVYSFTPNRTGTWIFRTSGNDEAYLLLRDSSPGDSSVAYYIASDGYVTYGDGDSSWGNTFMAVHLEEGTPYMIEAGYHNQKPGSFVMTIDPPETEG